MKNPGTVSSDRGSVSKRTDIIAEISALLAVLLLAFRWSV
jgi:hypothetical protein